VVTRSAATPAPSFAAAKQYRTTNGASDVAIADLNGDGKPDLVATNPSEERYEDDPTGTVSVRLNHGDGTFTPRRDYVTGDGPVSVAVADVNGDGKPDLATANSEDIAEEGRFTVSVLVNRGNGSFWPRRDYEVGDGSTSVALGDVNGDGWVDLVVSARRLSVLLNNGDGTFGTRHDYEVGEGPDAIVLVDLNGDGALDVAATAPAGATLSVLLNKGDGSFEAAGDYAAGSDLTDIATGDLNGDGRPDVVVAHDSLFEPSYVSVFLNAGDGSLGAKRNYWFVEGEGSVAIADVNRDGKLDVVAGNASPYLDRISIFYGLGGGTFMPALAYPTGSGAVAVAVGDLNGDGEPDLVSANDDASGDNSTVSVLLNRPGLCNVQNLRRMTIAVARATLARASCRLGRVTSVSSRAVRKGHVVSQSPVFGAVLHSGRKVGVVVSKGAGS
jgi:hypothetical protein